MDWQGVPIGMIRHDELLNALLAIWKTQYSIIANRRDHSEFSEGYQLGFEEGLDAVAQIAGLTELFEAGKASHRAKTREKLNLRVDFIESPTRFLKD
jgi:hypothetical protein